MNGTSPLAWVTGYSSRSEGICPNTYTAEYGLIDLMKKGLIDREEGTVFLEESGLNDFFWQLTWPEDYETPDEYLIQRIVDVQGYVVFVHGWTGNHKIWEYLPGMTVLRNRQLVGISVDHNGFGKSVFSTSTPKLDACNPPGAAKALGQWANLIKIRRQPGDTRRKVINFVGHSMGGATLFYMNPMFWSYGEITRYSLAPALLLDDDIHRAFYTTLGIGIGILQRIPRLEFIERFVKPTILKQLTTGSTNEVKEIHGIQYDETPRGITGATFLAMGRLEDWEIPRDWDLFRVMLGHRDPLVGLVEMMDLLGELEFPVSHIRVVSGSHYMFSVGTESPNNAFQHAQAREIVVDDILTLHQAALDKQKQGQRFG